ncbi:hypothetical protein JIG36_36600 [Actinoplanes sp. LDG1-06]|uniref:Uncharacterized protein n=1 Tax=Paractinoplanes ovalisporus TaxID=2810368 RepID=A0ABS2AML2_9ACTN|nr:hypothetical protein [Actinoplanes ovalisporus]MBM2621035.1 hypothetical protein [Actinoplanes ovalisporus]
MALLDVAWVDQHYDRENAGLGRSRFAEHVWVHAKEFDDCWGDISPVGFACVAWRLATAPHLDPGFVRLHRRVVRAELVRNSWDGSLTAAVDLVAPWPAALTTSRSWTQDRGWRDWPETFGQFLAPSQQELSRIPHVRSTLAVQAPLPFAGLPAIPDSPGPELPDLAERAVTVLARELNDLLAPMVTELENGR